MPNAFTHWCDMMRPLYSHHKGWLKTVLLSLVWAVFRCGKSSQFHYCRMHFGLSRYFSEFNNKFYWGDNSRLYLYFVFVIVSIYTFDKISIFNPINTNILISPLKPSQHWPAGRAWRSRHWRRTCPQWSVAVVGWGYTWHCEQRRVLCGWGRRGTAPAGSGCRQCPLNARLVPRRQTGKMQVGRR